VLVLAIVLIDESGVFFEIDIVRVDDKCTGNQDPEYRKHVKVELEDDMSVFAGRVVVDEDIAENALQENTDSLQQEDTNELRGTLAHEVLGLRRLADEPLVDTAAESYVQQDEGQEHSLQNVIHKGGKHSFFLVAQLTEVDALDSAYNPNVECNQAEHREAKPPTVLSDTGLLDQK